MGRRPSMPPHNTHQVALAVLLLAFCASLAVAVAPEAVVPEAEFVHQDAGKTNGVSDPEAKVIDNSRDVVATAMAKSAKIIRKGNKAARKAEEDKAAKTAEIIVAKALKGVKTEALKTARETATRVGKTVASATVPKVSSAIIGAKAKLSLLHKDVVVIQQAVLKAKNKAADAKQAMEDLDAQNQAKVNEETVRTKKDLMKLLATQKTFKGTRTKKKLVLQNLLTVDGETKRLNTLLADLTARLKRVNSRGEGVVNKSKQKMADRVTKLKSMLVHYKGRLKGQKKKLSEVKKATDINKELAVRITKSQAVVKQQKAKITELEGDRMALEKQSRSTKSSIVELLKTVAKRENELTVARDESSKLSRLAAELKHQAKKTAPPLNVKTGNHGNSKRSTEKAVTKINAAILKAGTDAKTKMLQAVKKEAEANASIAASQAAVKNTKLQPKIPGMNSALLKVGKLMSNLGLSGIEEGKGETGKAPVEAEPKTVTEDRLVEETDQDEATKLNTGLNRALETAGGTLTELHLRSLNTNQVHKAELLAHVAHTLFQKAMATGKTADKNAAKAAMKNAISFRNMLA